MNSPPGWPSRPGPSPLPTPLCPAILIPPPTPPMSKSSPSAPTTRSPLASSGSCQSSLNSPVGQRHYIIAAATLARFYNGINVCASTAGLSQSLASSAPESAPHYAAADIISLQELSDGGAFITSASMNLFAGVDSSLREFPRDRLSFKEKLGEGQFGEVLSSFISSLVTLLFIFRT